MPISINKLTTRWMAAGILVLLGPQSHTALAAPDCQATAVAKSFTFSGGVFKPEFAVQGVAGCGPNPASTGKVGYSLRIEDGDGKSDIFKNFDAQWIDRQGMSFSFSPESPEKFTEQRVRKVIEVIDVTVKQCGCTN